MDIVNRIKHYMDSTGTTISQFSDRCGIPRPTMSQMLNGRNKRVSDEVIAKIHNAYPRLSIMWLLFGEGEMESVANIEISEPQTGGFSPESASDSAVIQNIAAEFEEQAPYGISVPENDTPYSSTYKGIDFGDSLFDRPGMGSTNDEIAFNGTDASVAQNGRSAAAVEAESNHTPISADVSPTADTSSAAAQSSPGGAEPISILPDSRKKITNIVVFYSDNSFQSFLPEK